MADDKKDKPVLNVPPATQASAEMMMAEDYEPNTKIGTSVGPYQAFADSEEGFVGVDSQYQNYANETDAPLAAESGPEKDIEDAQAKIVEDAMAPADEESKSGTTTSPAPATTAPAHAAPTPPAPGS